mgnify:CR=1 FL=1
MRLTGRARHYYRLATTAMLQLDRPAPPRSEQEIAGEVQRNYRWNFSVNLLDSAVFLFGLSFISSSTIAPLFVSKLTTSPLAIGLVAVIAQAGWLLPQLFTANFVERLPRKKPFVINLGFFLERLPMWLLVVAAWIAVDAPTAALLVFFVGYAWHSFGAGVVATSWQDLLARCFPVARRGSFFGISTFAGTGMGALGAILSIWLLETYPFSTDFVYIFIIAAIALLVSWIFLALTREPAHSIRAEPQSNRQFFASLPGILRRDLNFRRFLLARSLLALGSLGTGFVAVAAIQRWQVPDSTVGIFTTASLLGQTLGNLSFGFMADRFGHKLSLELGALSSVLAFSLAWLAPTPVWYYAVFFLLGINLGAVLVSGILAPMEFSEPQRRPTYVGMANTATGLVSIVAPLLGAWLVSKNYNLVFAVGAAVNLAALIALRWWVREPRWTAVIKV